MLSEGYGIRANKNSLKNGSAQPCCSAASIFSLDLKITFNGRLRQPDFCVPAPSGRRIGQSFTPDSFPFALFAPCCQKRRQAIAWCVYSQPKALREGACRESTRFKLRQKPGLVLHLVSVNI